MARPPPPLPFSRLMPRLPEAVLLWYLNSTTLAPVQLVETVSSAGVLGVGGIGFGEDVRVASRTSVSPVWYLVSHPGGGDDTQGFSLLQVGVAAPASSVVRSYR